MLIQMDNDGKQIVITYLNHSNNNVESQFILCMKDHV
jgi:hypothetical protein